MSIEEIRYNLLCEAKQMLDRLDSECRNSNRLSAILLLSLSMTMKIFKIAQSKR